MTHLGIVVAMTTEARSLAGPAVAKRPSLHLPEGISIEISGTGPRQAHLASRNLLENGAKALASWGSAGGLVPEVSPGSLILPKNILAANGSIYQADSDWHERLLRRLTGHMDLHTGPLTESEAVLTSPSEKMALFHRTGAVAVDMESAAVATAAHQAGVPFVAIRAIADPVGLTVPQVVLSAVDGSGRLRPFKLLKRLAGHPAELLVLIRLGRDFRAACASLATVARLAGKDLLVQ